MTQANYIVPPTNLMAWYEKQPNKTEVVRAITAKAQVSVCYARQWVKGLATAKRDEHLEVLMQITDIDKEQLFEFVE